MSAIALSLRVIARRQIYLLSAMFSCAGEPLRRFAPARRTEIVGWRVFRAMSDP
jgi:hypothetical protein